MTPLPSPNLYLTALTLILHPPPQGELLEVSQPVILKLQTTSK